MLLKNKTTFECNKARKGYLMSVHEAGFAKLGYLYQIRYALHRAIEDSDAYYIKLESLDDVEIETGSNTKLFQLKHHFHDSNLTDKSVDFWKSVGIWSGQILNEDIDTEEFKFYLVTTSAVQCGSIAHHLLTNKRNTRKAMEMMDAAAKTSRNKAVVTSISNYLKLSPRQKIQLCESIVILPKEDNTREIIGQIKQRLEYTVQIDFVDDLYEKLEGWWFNKVIELLFGECDKIWREEVRDKILQLSYDYHPDSLPIDFGDTTLQEEEKSVFMDYQFVSQLKLIGVGTERISNAILDYYKAYNQRTKWIKDDLLIEYDISDYEKRLVDSWHRFRLTIIDELGDASETELKKAGRSLLNWVETQADVRIKPRVSDRFVMTGSYHMLANKSPATVGWHPEFSDRLNQLLGVEV